MAQKIYMLENLDCANCAAKIEAKFNALPEVEAATITLPPGSCVWWRKIPTASLRS